jgi:hypothetical protein
LKVRRILPAAALRRLPLDTRDMFILSCLDDPLGVSELSEITPCSLEECMERVRTMVEHGAVDPVFDEQADAIEESRVQRVSAAPRRPSGEMRVAGEHGNTGVRMRPEVDMKGRTRVLIGAITLGRRRPSGAIEEPVSEQAVSSSSLLPVR